MDALIWPVLALAALVVVMILICPSRHANKTERRR